MDSKIVSNKVKFYKRCVLELTEFSHSEEDVFSNNTRNVAAAQTYLYGAIQTAIFIAAHTMQKFKLENGANYYEMFSILCKNGKLDSNNLQLYNRMLELRNRIMYGYDEITGKEVYSILQKDLPTFTLFLKDLHKHSK